MVGKPLLYLFCRSLTDLERTGYPAESMLLEALLHTFHGKYFYFGFKLTGTSHTESLTLEDVLKITGDESQIHSQMESNFDNCHTLAYQILPNSASKLATVTDFMRQSVSLLKHGNTLRKSVHQSTSSLSKSCSSQNASRSTVIGSYIENSNQDSVAFSFEESDNISDSSARVFSGKGNKTDEVFYENEKYCDKDKSFHLSCVTHRNKLFSKQNKMFEYSQEYSKALNDEISIFTNDIIKKLEYTCSTKELDISSTCSKIDHELKVREIKRSVTSLSQAIMTNHNCKNDCQNNRDTFQNKEGTQFFCQKSLDDVSHIHKAGDYSKLTVSKGKNSPCSLPEFSTATVLTDNEIDEIFKSDCTKGLENSESLTAFLESQLGGEDVEKSSNKAQNKEVLKVQENNSSNNNLTCAYRDMFSNSVAFFDKSNLDLIVKEPVVSAEMENTEKTKGKLRINELVMPDSEGLETFFETQFNDETIKTESKKDDKNENKDEGEKANLREIQAVSLPCNSHASLSCNINKIELELNKLHSSFCVVKFNDLPESEDLEAFLSSFSADDHKDSGMYSDNTATSIEDKKTSKSSDDIKNSVNSFLSENVCHGEKSSIKVSALNHSFPEKSKTESFDSIVQTNNATILKTENKQCHEDKKQPKIDLNNSNDDELDRFLANVSAEHVNANKSSNDRSQNEKSDAEKYLVTECTTNKSEIPKTASVLINCQKNGEKIKNNFYCSETKARFSQDTCRGSLENKSLDLEDYLGRIDSSENYIKLCNKTVTDSCNPELALEDNCDDNLSGILRKADYKEQSNQGKEKHVDNKELKLIVQKKVVINNSSQAELSTEETEASAVIMHKIFDGTGFPTEISSTAGKSGNMSPPVEGIKTSVIQQNDDTSVLSDDSFWDEICANKENLSNLEKKCALISIEDENYSHLENHSDKCYLENRIHHMSVWVSPSTSAENTSSDLFGETFYSDDLRELKTLPNKAEVIVGDSDTDDINSSHPEADDSIIIDSPNTFTTENPSKGDSLLNLLFTRKRIAENQLETVKNVKFDRRLRRVSSCQLMDIKMKLNESPLGKNKLRRKSCLKVRGAKPKQTDSLKDNDNVAKFREAGLGVVEEKSHFQLTETGIQEQISSQIVCGSQDLFEELREDYKSDMHTYPDKQVLKSNNTVGATATNQITGPTRKDSGEPELETSFTSNLQMLQGNQSLFSNSGSQDLFAQSPQVCSSNSNSLCHASSSQKLFEEDKERTFNSPLLDSKNSNSDKVNMCLSCNEKQNANHSNLATSSTERFRISLQNSNLVYHTSSANNLICNTGKKNLLQNVLLDITNLSPGLDQSEAKDLAGNSKTVDSNRQKVVLDTPDLNSCGGFKTLNHLKSHSTKNIETSAVKTDCVCSKLQQKEVIKLNNAVETKANIVLEDSPDLFGDSPCYNRNVAHFQLKSKCLNADTLCKKLFK